MALKNGLFYENDELIYYKDGAPQYAGVIQVDGDIYCIDYVGKAVKGRYIVHKEMTNGILKHGTYVFGEDYKLVPDSYVAPKVVKKRKGKTIKYKKVKVRRNIWRSLKNFEHKKQLARALLMVALVLCLVWVASLHQTRGVPKQAASTIQNTTETVKEPTNEPTNETANETANETVNEPTNEPVNETKTENARITLPQYIGDVLLCSQAAKKEYDGEITIKEAVQTGDPYRPFVFEYSFTNCSGTLLLGEKSDLSDAIPYDLPEDLQSIEIHNLKVDTDYYYKVLVADQEYLGNFHTALSTRYFYIPGLENTRDIGGYTTLDGKRVKQGLLIRGVEPDGLATIELFIPDDKLEEVQREYDFVYDMDLRAKRVYIGEFTSRFGIPHDFYYAPQYGEVFNTGFRTALKRVFSDLAKPENYPMYLHCTWGRDRTGTIIYLLQGVLNVSQEDMVQEYLRSAYWFKKMATSEDLRVIDAGLEPYAGDTLQEKIVTFLITEIGVTEEEIASIRSILLEEGK